MEVRPKILFRGDADRFNGRELRRSLRQRQLQTMLLKGGIGHEIFLTGILDLVKKHVHTGWHTSHFLSFSEDRIRALSFGACLDPRSDLLFDSSRYTDCFDDDEPWSFALISLDTSYIEWQQHGPGLYKGSYPTAMPYFDTLDRRYHIMLINVVEALEATRVQVDEVAIHNARRDKEWLLLPMTYKQFSGSGRVEYSAIIDAQSMFSWELFREI